MNSPKIKRALISVSDKSGLDVFAQALEQCGVEIYSTGGTRKYLEEKGIKVKDVSEYTGFPEMMDGRLKTLHPKVFGGLLCRHDRADDMNALIEHGILTFELVVVNLYPFAATIARPDCTFAQAVEKIDIGGPSLVRAAGKNHQFTTIATDASEYDIIIKQIQSDGCTTLELRRKLAAAAFAHTATYDRTISEWFANQISGDTQNTDLETDSSPESPATGIFSPSLNLNYQLQTTLRYGENPHQQAAVYVSADAEKYPNTVTARQLNGKELSYNNLMDLDAALNIVLQFNQPAVSVIKHNNPCGASESDTLALATQRALEGDPLSAFGSILGMNRTVDEETAHVLSTPGLFVEAIIAEDFTPEALKILTTVPKWRNNVRLMAAGDLSRRSSRMAYRFIESGLLVQESDNQMDPEDAWSVVTDAQPDMDQLNELRFAWTICRFVKSNAIVITKDRMLLGAGAGQMSRVDSVEIAIQKAGDRISGAVLASDAFFPFPDSIERAHQAGITALIQPGGSKNDADVIAACNKYGIAMVFTGRRHFKH